MGDFLFDIEEGNQLFFQLINYIYVWIWSHEDIWHILFSEFRLSRWIEETNLIDFLYFENLIIFFVSSFYLLVIFLYRFYTRCEAVFFFWQSLTWVFFLLYCVLFFVYCIDPGFHHIFYLNDISHQRNNDELIFSWLNQMNQGQIEESFRHIRNPA